MKRIKILFILLLNLCVGELWAQNSTPLIVKGQLQDGAEMDAVGLYRSVDGFWECVSTAKPDLNGNYVFAVVAPKMELFAVGRAVNTGTKDKAIFCGMNGEQIELISTKKIQNYNFKGSVSKNNIILQQWEQEYQRVLPDYDISYTFRELYPNVDGFLKKSKEYAAKVKSNDAEFDKFLKLFIETQPIYGLIYFHLQPATSFPSDSERLPLLATLSETLTFDSPLYAQLPFCCTFLACLEANQLMLKKDKINFESASDEVKINFFLSKMQGGLYQNYDDFLADYQKCDKLITKSSQRQKVDAYIMKNGFMAAGKPAIDFTYPDIDGKSVSLSDFKGKVVVVDVWATWCGPCKTQIPHLKKLEKEFEDNKDIVFIAVSVDKEKDKAVWKQMVADEQMSGIHLFANGFSEITKSYNITGIPRFMIFDKKGNIVSSDAPRPSEPRMKAMILNELKK